MSAKLEQLLNYLDRADVTEIIVGIGRPIAIKMGQSYTPLTSQPVSELQFQTLVGGSVLDRIAKAATAHVVDCDIGKRHLRVELLKRPDGATLRIQPAPAASGLLELEDSGPPLELEVERPSPRAEQANPRVEEPKPRIEELKPRIEDPKPRIEEPKPSATKFQTTIAMPKIATPRAASEPGVIAGATQACPASAVSAIASAVPALAPESDSAAVVVGDDVLVEDRVDVSGIAAYVRAARQLGASDLHISANRAVQVRVSGDLRPIDERAAPLPADVTDRILLPLLGPRRRVQLRTSGYVDLAFDVQNAGRLRGNVSRQQGGLRGAFRLARVTPPTLEELALPRDLAKVVSHHQGLVVIAGPNGQGKTTTMAALVDLVNSTKAYHIITIEDPVELEHPRKQAVVTQREVGRHTKSFAAALKASLREDPDVIVIGELRDRETVEIALTAAETGHLVLATMSTPSAAKTIDRLIDMFPPADQAQARASIAGALRAVVAQRLVPGRGGGVVPVVELVTGVLPLAVLIRDDKLYQLPNLMQRGRAYGMIRFEDSLLELLRSGKISEDTVHRYSPATTPQAKAQVTQAMGRVGRKE